MGLWYSCKKKPSFVNPDREFYPTPVLLIVGAGASGMLAAVSARRTARELGIPDGRFRIVLLERNQRPGAKIAISGGGHCNLTHEGEVKELLEKGFLVKSEQRFLRHAVHRFSNSDLLDLFGSYGLRCVARQDGRLFPASGRSGEVLEVLHRLLEDASVSLVTGFRADSLHGSLSGFTVTAGSERFEGDALILATGGASWGSSGTTGDGIRLAAGAGHKIVPVSPALAPLFFAVPPRQELVGITLRNVLLVATPSAGETVSRRGDVLVSHRGVSGPACLSLSRSVAAMHGAGKGAVRIWADLFPGHDESSLSAFILQQTARHGSRLVRTFLQRCPLAPDMLVVTDEKNGVGNTIPNAFVEEIIRQAEIGHEVMMSSLTRTQRQKLAGILKKMPLGMVRKVPLDRAEVSAGGVSLEEIEPKTMQSRINPHLYCCGELLDYTGEVGGFNLQAAFSTGWVAGMHAARALLVKARQPDQTAQE
jgi:predicted Rossmann fold flavoprotein